MVKIIEEVLKALDGNISQLEDALHKADTQQKGVMLPVRFFQTIRSLSIGFESYENDRIASAYSAGNYIDYTKFLEDIKTEAENKRLKEESARSQHSSTGVADSFKPMEEQKKIEKSDSTTPLEESKEPAKVEIHIPFEDTLALFREVVKPWDPTKLFAKINTARKTTIDIRSFGNGVREILEMPEEIFPNTSIVDLWRAFAGNEHTTMELDVFKAMCGGTAKQNIKEFKLRYFAALMHRHTSLYESFSGMEDKDLGYVSAGSLLHLTKIIMPRESDEILDNFIRECTADPSQPIREIEPISFAKFAGALRFAATEYNNPMAPEKSATKSEAGNEPESESDTPKDEETPEERQRRLYQSVKEEFRASGENYATRIHQGILMAVACSEKANEDGEINFETVSPSILIRVLVAGVGCKLSLAQKDFITSHCVDPETGNIKVREFLEYYNLVKEPGSMEIPRKMLGQLPIVATALTESAPKERAPRTPAPNSVSESSRLLEALDESLPSSEPSRPIPAPVDDCLDELFKYPPTSPAPRPISRTENEEIIMGRSPYVPPQAPQKQLTEVERILGGTAEPPPAPTPRHTPGGRSSVGALLIDPKK